MMEVLAFIGVAVGFFVAGRQLCLQEIASTPDSFAKTAILGWVESGGFADTHQQNAPADQIADDMVNYFRRNKLKIVSERGW
jgi:hypothetical protein